MKTTIASIALLILTQLTSAGPIQRNNDVVRRQYAYPKRYVVNNLHSIQPIKARQFGGTVSNLDPEATATKKGTEDGAVPAVGVGLPDNTSLLSLLTQTTVTADATSTSLFGQQPAQSQEATLADSSIDANTVTAGQSTIFPIGVTISASSTTSYDSAAAAQTTTVLAATTQTTTEEVTVIFVTESATFPGATAGFSTLTPDSLITTISIPASPTTTASAISTVISVGSSIPQIETRTTTQTGPFVSSIFTSFPAASTTQQDGEPSTTITLASQTTVVVAVAPSFAVGSTVSPIAATSITSAAAAASAASGGVGPLGVVFTVSSSVAEGSVVTGAVASSTTNTATESGFTTTIQTSLASDAPLSVVPITPGVAVVATGVGVSTVTVT